MADRDLPVWTIPPNWSEAVLERLEWLTDVLDSRSGAEQRTGLRLTPRRSFEFKVTAFDETRSLFDLWLDRLGANECLLPLWHDKGRLSVLTNAGTIRLHIDTTYREFEVGGLALIFRDVWTWEVVEINALDDAGLDLVSGTTGMWDEGTAVYPLRVAMLDPEVTSSAITSRVGESKVGFTINRANPYDAGAEVLPTYDGLPVVTLAPNRMDALETRFSRIMDELDNSTGLRRRYDENPRNFQTQFYNWQAKGRQAHAALRASLYRLAGRQKAAWMPSFNQDVTLALPLAIGANNITIKKIGYRYVGGTAAMQGRRDLMLKDGDGDPHFVRISGTTTDPAPGLERLTLTAGSSFAAPTGRSASFMATVRMDQDLIEITHHTDSDGVCECSAAFKAFSNTRSITGPLVFATPVEAMGITSCGTPAPSEQGICSLAVFEGWYFRMKVSHGSYAGEYPTDLGAWNNGIVGWGGPNATPTGLGPGEVGWQWNYLPGGNPSILDSPLDVRIMEQHGIIWSDPWPAGTRRFTVYYQRWDSPGWTEANFDPTYGDYYDFSHATPSMIYGPGTVAYGGVFPHYWRFDG